MRRRLKLGWSAMAVACLLAIGFAPAATAQQDVCINVDGVEIYRFGSAECDSGDGSVAVAVGTGSLAWAGNGVSGGAGGDDNIAIATGDDSGAVAGSGFDGGAGGNDNIAIATGDDSGAVVGSGGGIGLVGGDDITSVAFGPSGCRVTISHGQVFFAPSCLQ